MQLNFYDDKSFLWTSESIQLYRILQQVKYNQIATFPEYTAQRSTNRKTINNTHHVLMRLLDMWQSNLNDHRTIEVKQEHAIVLIDILNYRPYLCVDPRNYVSEQLSQLEKSLQA